jgi:NAD(P)-dependent dehydrogenase (short-subunit alcohol dehydrogenase family)
MSPQFAGKVALVTGAGSGIGEATAVLLAQRGAAVAIVGRSKEKLDRVAHRIAEHGGEVLPVVADVSDATQVQAAVTRTVSKFGALHHAVNNAGVTGVLKPLEEISVEDWNRVIGIDLSGLFYGVKYAAPAIAAAGGGSIVNVSSVFADRGGNSTEYVSAKHGIRGLTRAAAIQYAAKGVRINELQPGVIYTDMTDADPQGRDEVARRGIPAGRIGDSREVATAIAFLLSDDASYVVGAHLAVDGGFLA